MRHSRWARQGGTILLRAFLLGALALPAPAAAAGTWDSPGASDWYEVYRRAVADVELENWESVEARIREAIAVRPDSKRNVRTYGMWHASYIPYYYLGMAQYRLGRHQEALRSFGREEAAGVVQHDPVAFLKLKKMAARIRAGAAPPAAPAAPAPAPANPPEEGGDVLMLGLQSFFQGDYVRSIAAFQESLKKGPAEDLTLHLYLGMAYAGKAAEDVSQRDLWRNMAFLEFRQVHEIDPAYDLSPGVFSDEMVTLFKEAEKKP